MYREEPLCAASYLLWTMQRGAQPKSAAALIDNNTSHALKYIDEEFVKRQKQFDLQYDDVKYIIVTHVHLDHAGATGHLLKKCPNAVVLCHPKAARHLANPSRLISAAAEVYGNERFKQLYGEVLPCEESRIKVMADGEAIELCKGRELQFFHVEGHAKHHMIVMDTSTQSIFAGDAYGINNPWFSLFNIAQPFFYPSSSPPDFDAGLQRVALAKIADLQPKKVYLTHFGMVEDIQGSLEQLQKHLSEFEFIQAKTAQKIHQGCCETESLEFVRTELTKFFEKEFVRRGLVSSQEGFWDFFKSDVDLNAQGIFVASRRMDQVEMERVLQVEPKVCEKTQSLESPVSNSHASQNWGADVSKETKPSVDLYEAFRLSGLEQYIPVLQKQEIDKDTFVALTAGDMAAAFPQLSYGAKLRMEKLQHNIKLHSSTRTGASSDSPT